jgi:hypothetical protein
MTTVFISYRRQSAPGEARAIFENLTHRLGQNSVFMDVDSISLGRDFRSELQKTLTACDLMLVIIDKDWVADKDDKGQRRLDNPGDYVRMEIETALKRDIVVTPVLVKGAQMPGAEELPAEIRDLVYRNAFEITVNRWGSDLQEMIRRLGLDAPRPAASAGGEPEGRKTRQVLQQPIAIAGVVIAACLVAITAWFALPRPAAPPSASVTNPADAPHPSAAINDIIRNRPAAAQPTFMLTLGGTPARSNPSVDDVAAAVKAATARKEDPFLVLTRSDKEFIQAYYETEKSWTLEYRAGTLQFSCDQPPDTEQVIKTMQLYREDNAGWAETCKWRALKLKSVR